MVGSCEGLACLCDFLAKKKKFLLFIFLLLGTTWGKQIYRVLGSTFVARIWLSFDNRGLEEVLH